MLVGMYILGTFQINFSDFVIGGAMKGVESRFWKVSNGGAASSGKFRKMCSNIESIVLFSQSEVQFHIISSLF